MLLGALDPLEGSVVIVVGAALAAAGGHLRGSRHRRLLNWSLALMAVGVGAMWGLSAVGGFGGTSGRSLWWGVTIVPYPVGWIGGLVGSVRAWRGSTAQ